MQTIEVDTEDGITVVRMAHPPANALDPEFLGDGLAALDALEADLPRAVVLTGSGSFFSGGADLKVVPTLSPEEQADMARGVNRLFSGWHTFPRPVVTAVNGHAVAGGLVLALCGDYRVVGTSGRFGLTEVKVGIPFPSAAMTVVVAELSAPTVRRLVLRGELFDASTAADLELFDEVVPDDEVLGRALEVAAELAALPPATYGYVKQRLRGREGAVASEVAGAAGAASAMAEASERAHTVLDRRRRR